MIQWFRQRNSKILLEARAVARPIIIGGGGGGVHIHILIGVLPDGFLLKAIVFTVCDTYVNRL